MYASSSIYTKYHTKSIKNQISSKQSSVCSFYVYCAGNPLNLIYNGCFIYTRLSHVTREYIKCTH